MHFVSPDAPGLRLAITDLTVSSGSGVVDIAGLALADAEIVAGRMAAARASP
jgi:hypothetical protein